MQPQKNQKVSDMLENETKKMEEKLELVKKMMELEKEKRSHIIQNSKQAHGGGTIWRGATTQKNIKGYSDAVLSHHKKAQPNLPPTTLITNVNSQQKPSAQSGNVRVSSSKGQRISSSKGMRTNANQNGSNQKQQANQIPKNVNPFTGNLQSSTQNQNVSKIEQNLLKNLKPENDQNQNSQVQQQKDDKNEVMQFLNILKLEKYFDKFIENGVEDQETILELKDEHLEQMGIPLGHKLKIVKKIKDMRTDKGMPAPQSRQGTSRAELNENKKDQQNNQQVSSLKTGQYDENESHSQFLEALNEWRNAPKANQEDKQNQKPNVVKKVRFGDNQTSNVDEEQKINPNKVQNQGVSADIQQKKKVSEKLSCWNCYKLYVKSEETQKFNILIGGAPSSQNSKSFCSEVCFKKYQNANSEKCALEECKIRFLKSDINCICIKSKWFCCDEHAELDPQNNQFFQDIENQEGQKEIQ